MKQSHRHLMLATAMALVLAVPVAATRAEENATVPTAPGFKPGTGQINPGPQAQAPSQSTQVISIPTPEEARAAFLERVSTQPSLGSGPTETLPVAEVPQSAGAEKQRESKNTAGGPQATGANAEHPQAAQQAMGESTPAGPTSGVASSPKTDGRADATAAPDAKQGDNSGPGGGNGQSANAGQSGALTGEPKPSGPIGAIGQTMPAKFSKRNDILDRVPIMAYPLALSDQDRQKIYAAVMADKSAPVEGAEALTPASELSTEQALNGMHPLPEVLSGMAQVQRFKYVKAKDKVLLVEPSTRVVVEQIKA